jgi:hypothetical protein
MARRKRTPRPAAKPPTPPDLVLGPELAVLSVLAYVLDIATAALLAEHPTLIDDGDVGGVESGVTLGLRPLCLDFGVRLEAPPMHLAGTSAGLTTTAKSCHWQTPFAAAPQTSATPLPLTIVLCAMRWDPATTPRPTHTCPSEHVSSGDPVMR